MDPDDVLARLLRAMNDRDIDAFVACIAEDYRSEQPLHPAWAFRGREQVRENWTGVFREVPDFSATLVASAIAGDTIWAEWDWRGTRTDGSTLHMRGVTLFGVEGGLVVWGRLYMELVQEESGGIQDAVDRMRQGA